ncbi:hypothetical protein [Caulobacter henricii]|uniref:hypothetical protein n=1 Tax=Caulobacter henricii TaxID=69395 RepID=UPI000A8F709D|nr:hypothetical protein [Caulobacter henricii]
MDAADPGRRPATSMDPPAMSAARLFSFADKALMTVLTVALIVGVPVSAITFVVQTL